MVKSLWNYIERQTSESGASGTATYDLPEGGFIPEIIVTAYSTPTGSTNPCLPLSDAITKIEIADGGNVLISLTGNQIKARSMIHKYTRLGSTELNDNAVEGYDQFFIPLGGRFGEVDYAPNMGVFQNPQIKISWDYSTTTTVFGMTCDADTAPAMKFSVLCNQMSDPGKYTHGYLKSTSLKQFTQATSTETRTKLPTKDLLIGVGLEAGYDAKDFGEDVEEAELNFNNGEWKPFHLYEEEIHSIQQAWFNKPFSYSWYTDFIDAKELDVHMGYPLQVICTPGIEDVVGLAFAFDANRRGVETPNIMDLATPTACTVYQQFGFTSLGYEPFHLWYCPMRKILGDQEDTIDASVFSRIEFLTKSGSAASTSMKPTVVADYLIL